MLVSVPSAARIRIKNRNPNLLPLLPLPLFVKQPLQLVMAVVVVVAAVVVVVERAWVLATDVVVPSKTKWLLPWTNPGILSVLNVLDAGLPSPLEVEVEVS